MAFGCPKHHLTPSLCHHLSCLSSTLRVWTRNLGFATRPFPAFLVLFLDLNSRLFPTWLITSRIILHVHSILFILFLSYYKHTTMATTVAPSYNAGSPLSQVTVNVRLCGSIPRQEMESLTLKQHHYQSSKLSDRHAAISLAVNTIERDSAAGLLCSQLSIMQQQQHPQATSTLQSRSPPTYEPPTWAVPSRGEARLEVRTKEKMIIQYLSFGPFRPHRFLFSISFIHSRSAIQLIVNLR